MLSSFIEGIDIGIMFNWKFHDEDIGKYLSLDKRKHFFTGIIPVFELFI